MDLYPPPLCVQGLFLLIADIRGKGMGGKHMVEKGETGFSKVKTFVKANVEMVFTESKFLKMDVNQKDYNNSKFSFCPFYRKERFTPTQLLLV